MAYKIGYRPKRKNQGSRDDTPDFFLDCEIIELRILWCV